MRIIKGDRGGAAWQHGRARRWRRRELGQRGDPLLPLRPLPRSGRQQRLDDQDGVDVRVLIIDDASPDDSAAVAREIATRRDRVEVIVHDVNQGNIATFNEGLLEWLMATTAYSCRPTTGPRPEPSREPGTSWTPTRRPAWSTAVPSGSRTVPLPAARTTVRGWSVWSGQSGSSIVSGRQRTRSRP